VSPYKNFILFFTLIPSSIPGRILSVCDCTNSVGLSLVRCFWRGNLRL